ncbi:MAG: pyruvate, phosphate dikinase [Planctomycetes bacterium]|nr:pyruvate, phosphate dikinase [Planctomycetota bacterium]
MTQSDQSMQELLIALQERAKELSCLYAVDEILNLSDASLDVTMRRLVDTLPLGWQYPTRCVARVKLDDRTYVSQGFDETAWSLTAPIVFEGEPIGSVAVFYTQQEPAADEGPFLTEERRLINAIAERIGHYVLQRRLRRMRQVGGDSQGFRTTAERFRVVLDFVRTTDRKLLVKLTRRMINHLGWNGVAGAEELLSEFVPQVTSVAGQENRPLARATLRDLAALAERTFLLAEDTLGEEEVLGCIRSWIREDRASFLYGALEKLDTSLTELAGALERFHAMELHVEELPSALRTGLSVALIRRFFSEDLAFIRAAKGVVRVEDFHDLAQRTVIPPDSHGKLGGKCAGLFLASRIVQEAAERFDVLRGTRAPRTWHVASDGLLHFIRYNDLEEVYDRKYRDIDQVRQDYPYLVQLCKASPFPPEMAQGLSAALDDFGENPIIVRSSSLLEDRVGSAFSGKYKSLFLANQGSKARRLTALQDAIAEVYASVFGPDPIEYRGERGLLDVHEEMGIMIQEVVGRRIGPYFLPSFSGVAYSRNEFRWSSRIRREDGLVRLVLGLGTRAVDRVSDDYPVLVAPGQPNLRVHTMPDETLRYSPRQIDVIDLQSESFTTIDIDEFLTRFGRSIPGVHRLVSRIEQGILRKPLGSSVDFGTDHHVVTFDGLISDTPFVARIRLLMDLLAERLGTPVDVEFAADGDDFYLLQCRAQGSGDESAPAEIPHGLPADDIVFTADRFVSNGRVPDLTHVVYVDENAYSALPDPKLMQRVADAVGRLNKVLPRHRFALVGPGRWGSRGDIRLGVGVTYSQISNTALLIEVARQKGGYVPDVSFGTHFFQDLVESGIRYLPLYPDTPGVVFSEAFFRRAPNALVDLLPQFGDLTHVLRVLDVERIAPGRVLRVLMNADLEQAVAFLAKSSG